MANVSQGRAHDAAMSDEPWVAAHETEDDFAGIFGRLRLATMGERGTANAAGIAWMRNNLRDLLDAAEERDRLRAKVEALRKAWAEWDRTVDYPPLWAVDALLKDPTP